MGATSRAVFGFLIGAGLAATGLWLGARAPGAATAGPLPSPNSTTAAAIVAQEPREIPWVREGGSRFESTVVVPTGLEVAERSAELDYTLMSLGQGATAFGPTLPGALPESWRLETTGGVVYEATVDPPRVLDSPEPTTGLSDAVSFEVPDDLTSPDVATISVTGWRIPIPVDLTVDLAPERGASFRLFDGSTVVLDTIIEQRNGTILDFDVVRPLDPWRTDHDAPFSNSTIFRGAGAGWRSAATTYVGTGIGGGPTGFQLTWNAPTAPETISIAVRTTVWQPLSSAIVVYEGASRG